MRLVLRRAAMARTLLIAAALTATLTTALLTAFLQYARLLPDEGTRAALMKMPAQQRSLLISGAGGTNAADLVAREEYIQDRFAHGLGGMPVSAIGGGYAIGQQLPDGLGATISRAGGTYAVVAFLDRLPEHATLVSGDWPKPVARTEPAQVALAERTASVLRVGVGDRIPVNDRRTGWPAPLTVVGVFRPIDPDGPYWQLAADPVNNGGYGPLVVDREEFRARYAALSTLEWVVAPTPAALTSADLPAVAGALDELRYAGLPGPDKAWFPSLRTGLDDLAGRLTTTRLVSRSGLLLPALLIIVIAGYALFLVARLLADQRRGELSLLRARGAAGTQLARLALGEALLVVTPAALLGAPLGGALLRLGDVWSTGHGLRLAAVAGNGAIGWMIALAAAAGCAAALVLPAARRGGSWVAEQQRRPRPSRWTTVQRAGVDAALVAVAVLAWLQLRQYAGPLTRVGGSLDIDPLLVAAPVVGVLAATAVSLRLLPAATRVGVGAAQRRDSHATLLGMWHADRRPHAGPVLLLVLAVAASALASCVAASWQRSQRDQAAHAVGTDLRLTRAGGEQLQLSTGDLAGPGVRAASTAYRTKLNAGNESAELIAIDTAAAPDVVRLRGDLAEPDALRRLAAARPAVPGQVLPAGTRRLTGHIGYVARVRNNVGEAVPGVLTAILDDGSGTLYHRELGQPRADGTLDFDVPVPTVLAADAHPPRLIALTMSVTVRAVTASFEVAFVSALVDWRVSGLRTVDRAGTASPVTVPAQWSVGEYEPTDSTGLNGHPDTALTTAPEPLLHADLPATPSGGSWRFVVSGLGGLTNPVPPAGLATPELLAATGSKVGDTVRLGAGTPAELPVHIVGTIASVPSSGSTAAVLVDLPALDAYRVFAQQILDPPTEWWLATDPAQHARLAASFGQRTEFVVADRVTLARRLLADPLGWGVLFALYAAVFGAIALAAFGLAVDARAASLRSAGEFAVLHTLGTPPATLARALVVEQSVLAGLGVLSGLGVGVLVAAAMAPSLVLTERGGRPVPEVLLVIPPWPVIVPAAALFLVALALGATIARRVRRDVTAGLLRIGADR